MAKLLHAFPLSKETYSWPMKTGLPLLPSPPHSPTLSPVTWSPFKLFDVVLNNLPLGVKANVVSYSLGDVTTSSRQGLMWASWKRPPLLPRVVLLTWRGGKSCEHSLQTQRLSSLEPPVFSQTGTESCLVARAGGTHQGASGARPLGFRRKTSRPGPVWTLGADTHFTGAAGRLPEGAGGRRAGGGGPPLLQAMAGGDMLTGHIQHC